ncbi:pantoate--beta-alanine ligase [Nitrosomonas sp.]|uniref:pantoate--beta-alanine ligase n=1 Tax=Nitrosomonas sp. TaxID=42353 RepID=UPI0028515BE3|nr:pantoate--beta-alanine ligase [Nitrosomonas sp.]MCP5243459.1 pantoate--beta-alanine ligase [Burkholderiales bacterium]MDR4515586.1 pantoate--beta-alanine ligase [Nitrosomonas sp.]
MKIVKTITALRSTLKNVQNIAFVPTMGNLHEGHLALVKRAKKNADFVVVSIFVNPLQFLPSEDFNQYPRSLEADCKLLRDLDVDLVFTPEEKDLFPVRQEIMLQLPAVADTLEGKFRPGFFQGVATIVLKFLNIIQPDMAVFGKKDYQQLHIIRLMVQQLNFPIKILDTEIIRAVDGLALSSRNQYLNGAERQEACHLYRVLNTIVSEITSGQHGFLLSEKKAVEYLSERGWGVDYVSIVNQQTLLPASTDDQKLAVLAAARIGTTRLIDNVEFTI